MHVLNTTKIKSVKSTDQKCIDFGQLKEVYYCSIIHNFIALSQNCYGNYIIQEMLEQPQNCQISDALQLQITKILKKHFYTLSL